MATSSRVSFSGANAPINLVISTGVTGCSICGDNNYFLGSSRTFNYYAKFFNGFQHPIGSLAFYANSKNIGVRSESDGWTPGGAYQNSWFRERFYAQPSNYEPDTRCMSTFATANPFWIKTGSQGQVAEDGKGDYFILEKYMGLVSENISELNGDLIKWRDNGIYNGIASPFFLAFWLGGCGAPCYPCSREGVDCGDTYTYMSTFTDNMDNYWDVYNEDHYPYFYSGFVLDYYGRIGRGPEPNIGWLEYIKAMPDCEYCGCISFCILKECIDGWYGTRMYTSKIFTFDSLAGIPYTTDVHLKNFGKKIQDYYSFGNLDIKLNHLADEAIFVGGYADYQYGNIDLKEIKEPTSADAADQRNQDSLSFSKRLLSINDQDVILYGNFISGITEYDYSTAMSRFLRIPEASFTSGNGSEKVIIDSVRGSDLAKDEKVILKDLAVKYKNETAMPEITGFGWIYVDIPEEVQKESIWIKFTMDGGAQFPPEVDGVCPMVGCDLPKLVSNHKLERFFVRSTRSNVLKGITDSPPLPYWNVPSDTYYLSTSALALPYVTYNGPAHTQEYYKRYVKKIVKAPYNLYVKSGDYYFTECKLGETLKNLTPGRYYFPNPIRCQSQFEFFDLSSPAFDTNVPIDPSEESEFRELFNVNLNQFLGKDRKNESLELKYQEAVRLLGIPKDNAIRMELTATVKYSPDLKNLSADDIFGALNDAIKNGLIDQNTLDLLKQAGLITN